VDAAQLASKARKPITKLAALWARGVTLTSRVPHQCISRRLSSPARAPAPDAADVGRRSAGGTGRVDSGWMLRHRAPFVAVAILAGLIASPATALEMDRSRTAIISAGITSAGIAAAGRWEWPVDRFRLVAPYVQPADRYSAGHRGLDLQPIDGGAVLAPAPGIVAYAGTVADRPLITIDHGDGLVTTLEPVTASVQVGEAVARGDGVGEVSIGGHTTPGALHFGVRYDGEYINPLVLLGGVPRAVLLPCCG
jgi:murein DD-endopeptidase MepM/ murein hydrolase activator NlpD